MISGRTLRQGNIALALVAGFALLLFANYFGAKYWKQWDWTASHFYSLSDKTKSVLGALTAEVRVVSFLSERQQAEVDSMLREVRTLLDAYHTAAPQRINVDLVDVGRDPLRAQKLLKEFSIDPMRDSIDVIVVSSGSRTKLLRVDDLVEMENAPGMGQPPVIKALKAEDALTSALLTVTRQRRPRVVFATGHAERGVRDQRQDGLAEFTRTLEGQDIEVTEWKAFGATSVPAETDLLIIAGPQVAWLPPEVAAVRSYLEQGGRLILLLEPTLARGAAAMSATGFESLLREWGITTHDDIVIDGARATPFLGPETFASELLALHPATNQLGGRQVLFSLARSLATASPPAEVTVNVLAETSAEAWGETNLAQLDAVKSDPSDPHGPLALLLGAERKPKQSTGRPARLFCAGDADLASNLAFPSGSNRDLLLNAVAWLLDEQQALGIPPKDRALTKLFVTEAQGRSLLLGLVGGLPALTIAIGAAVWWRRRQGAAR